MIGKIMNVNNNNNNSINTHRKLNPYEQYDDEFIYGGASRSSLKNTSVGNTSSGNPYGIMTGSAKNFFSNSTNNINNLQNYPVSNPNFYPLMASNSNG